MTERINPRVFPSLTAAMACLLLQLPAATLQAQTWVPKGPAPGFGDFNTLIVEPDSPFGGALETVLAHPTNPNILWVGSVNGGIFRTDNATSLYPTWTAQTDGQPSLSIAALERDPTDASHQTLLAGIGNRSSFLSKGGALAGLLKTTNGGATWTQLHPSLINGRISGLAPRGSTVVAALDGPGTACNTLGVWRSINGGNNFTQVSNGGGLPCGFTHDLASDPTDPARLFVPVVRFGASDGLYRSTDTGGSWSEVGAGSVMDTALQAQPAEVQVAVGRAGGGNANVFVAVCDQGKLSGLFHSANAGSTWASLDLPMTNESGTVFGLHPGGQCSIHLSIVADPFDHSVVYVGGDRQPAANEGSGGGSFPNSLGATSFAGRLFKVDADRPPGQQATPITNCPSALAGCGGLRRTLNNTAPHADSREMVFDANGHLVQVDDGGVYRHTDPNGSNGDWVSAIGNLSAIEAYDFSYDTVANILFSGNQDNGATEQMSSSSLSWFSARGGDGGDTTVGTHDPVANQSTRYLSSQFLGGFQRRVYNLSNTLLSQTFPTFTPVSGPQISPLFVTPVKINAAAPSRGIAAGQNGIFESFDRFDSTTQISASQLNTDGFEPIAYGAASNVNALYLGVQNAVLVRLASPPTAPTVTFPGFGVDTDPIRGVVMDPDLPTTAFAVDQNSVYFTNNAFAGWSNLTGNLFTTINTGGGAINAVEYINQGGDRVVVGTDTGVFALASGATSWHRLGTGLPNALVYELEYDPENNLLAATTMGRGTWTLSLDGTCPWEQIFTNQTLNSAVTNKAQANIYLGPNLTLSNATGITMQAGQVIAFDNGVTVDGTFSANLGSCP